jgi:hypothetical protein
VEKNELLDGLAEAIVNRETLLDRPSYQRGPNRQPPFFDQLLLRLIFGADVENSSPVRPAN